MSERDVFEAALDLSRENRAAYLDGACGGDLALRQRLEALLRKHEEGGSFMESPAAGFTSRVAAEGPEIRGVATLDEPISERPGTVIGPYKLLEQIGAGGFGVVFMAEQEKPVRRKVALKIIKPGMDSKQVIARFEAERQALAMMDHQNIARVLDADTTASGRPYFVMELVHGVPITQFCDDRKLTTRERLALFVPVCQAIQHAHQKGVIHRDVKPSNVLVTMYDDKPVPKVIDFGVAKAVEQRLTEKTMFTQFGTLVGTFEYMSPEQAEMNAFGVDTRSDIYSLGVLLFELLTGTTPLERQRLREAALDEMVRLIKEEEAPRPSSRLSSSHNLPKIAAARNTEPARLSKLVRGDIDWIVMKCLEKDRTRRYESANGLARDIQRYLADEPVEACPPSPGYKLRKIARRYRTPLRVAGAFLLLLVLGAIVSTWQAIRATLAEHHANEQRDIARQNEWVAFQAREETAKERDKVAAVNQRLERTFGDLRRTLYVSDMNRAFKFWDEGNVQRVEELLERHRPRGAEADVRGLEWQYLRRLCARFQTGRVVDTQSAVAGLAISPDAKSLATTCMTSALGVWDTNTGAPRFSVPNIWAEQLAFTADGATLVSATVTQAPQRTRRSADAVVRSWDALTGKERSTARVQLDVGEVGQIALSSDGATLIGFTPEAKLRLWNTATGHELITLDAYAADPSIQRAQRHLMSLAPDGKTLAWQLGPTTLAWDLESKKLQFKHYQAHPWSFAVALSPDGKLLACHRGGPPHVIQVWDWKAGRQLAQLEGFQGHVYVLAFSPDGKLLAGGDEFAIIRVWDVATHKEIATLKGHGGTITNLVFAPDGQWLYSAASDGLVRRWKPIPEPDPDTIKGDIGLYAVKVGFSADSKTLFIASRAKAGEPRLVVKHWDLASRRELARFQGRYVIGVSADGSRVVVLEKPEDRSAELWDARTNTKLAPLDGHWVFGTGKSRFSPDSRTLALAEPDQIKLWETQTGQGPRLIKTPNAGSLAFSADGRMLAACTASTKAGGFNVTLWETATLRPIAELPGSAGALTFSPDGRILATLHSDTVTLWDISSQQVRTRLKLSQPYHADYQSVWANAFSPDGKAFCAADGVFTHVWDTTTGERLATLKGHRGAWISGLAWSPDGKTLATASGPEVKLWNVATREEVTTLVGTNIVGCLAFAPDGSLAVGDLLNSVSLWRTRSDNNGGAPGK